MANSGYKVSLMSVDFPLPLTPLTTISLPKGNVTLTFFKLLPLAPFNSINFPFPSLLSFGVSSFFLPLKNWAVSEFDFKTSCGVPFATIEPPNFPAFGPISTK